MFNFDNFGFTPAVYVKDSPALPPTDDDYFLVCQTAGTTDGHLLTQAGDLLYTPKMGRYSILCDTAATADGYLLTQAGEQLIY